MDWTKGFSSRYYVSIVDKDTWRDVGRLEITGGSIKRSASDIRHAADISVKNYQETGEPIIRVWLDARQEGDSSHTALFTGYATSPDREINGRLESRTLQCYSVLKAASDVLLPRGWYVPADMNAVEQIIKLLKVTNAPVEVVGDYSSLALKSAVVAEQNESHLTMVDLLLNIIGWRMTVDGMGKITISEYSKNPSYVFDADEMDILEPVLRDSSDWFSCPNVFRAVANETSAEARDEDPDSPFSIQNRGREIWVEETSCSLNEKETLSAYARRRLKELQQVGRTVNYDRRYVPDLTVSDLIRLNYPAQNIVGSFIVSSQTITLSYNAKTSEEVVQV